MILGFTGTQTGMTDAQKASVRAFLDSYNQIQSHHGDCIGSDADFHHILHDLGFLRIEIHPPTDSSKRAFCEGAYAWWPEMPYLDRNHAIVDICDTLLATPSGYRERVRSGTWATVRYARKAGKKVVIVWPDGNIEHE